MKICSKCKVEKELSSFVKRGSRFRSYCKKCKNIDTNNRINNLVHINVVEKNCIGCKLNFSISFFNKNRRSRDGHAEYCTSCVQIKSKNRYIKHKDRIDKASKKYYVENREKIRKQVRDSNIGEVREKRNSKKREYNKSVVGKEKAKLWYEKQMRESIQFKIKKNLRTRLNSAVRYSGVKKSSSAVKSLSMKIEQFIAHIESLFKVGMTWDDYGKELGKWNFDHYIPLSYFDLSDTRQSEIANHYLNILPSWSIDNYTKNNRIPEDYLNILKKIEEKLDKV